MTPAIGLFIGAIPSFWLLHRFFHFRKRSFLYLLTGIFVLLFLGAAVLASAHEVHDTWYAAAAAPILCALLAAFISLLIMPYSLAEATARFHVRDYLHTVDLSEFMTETFESLPDADHKGEALYTLLRVLYAATSSRRKSDKLFRQTMKTALSLSAVGNITTNRIFFATIRLEITDGITRNEISDRTSAVDCAVNLVYEAILSGYKTGELAPENS